MFGHADSRCHDQSFVNNYATRREVATSNTGYRYQLLRISISCIYFLFAILSLFSETIYEKIH